MVTRVSGEASTHHASGGRHSDAPPVALRRVRSTTREFAPEITGDHGMVTAEEREQLLALVSSFDREYFNGTLRRAQALFQCAQR